MELREILKSTKDFSPQTKLMFWLLVVVLIIVFGVFGITKTISFLSAWTDSNRIVTGKAITCGKEGRKRVCEYQFPVWVEKREAEVVTVFADEKELKKAVDESGNIEVASYICEKFGPAYCVTALAVAKAESGMREDALNINTNGTIDLGIFQINSIHYKKDGCKLKDVVTAERNIDCAYSIWLSHGKSFSPWVAYNNGNYLAHLTK